MLANGIHVTIFTVLQRMEELYNLSGSDRQTDEFMRPLIVDDTGTIRGMCTLTLCRVELISPLDWWHLIIILC